MVVSTRGDEVDRLFHALADRTRRDILGRVLESGQSVSGLAARYEMSFAAVQKHVTVLEGASLVTKQRRGREQIVNGNPRTLERARTLLADYERIWSDRIGRIDDILADDAPPKAEEASSNRDGAPPRDDHVPHKKEGPA